MTIPAPLAHTADWLHSFMQMRLEMHALISVSMPSTAIQDKGTLHLDYKRKVWYNFARCTVNELQRCSMIVQMTFRACLPK